MVDKKVVKKKVGRPKKKSMGKPPIFKSGEKLLQLFIDYQNKKGYLPKYRTYSNEVIESKAMVPISINGFYLYLKLTKYGCNRNTIYDTFKKYPDTKNEIDYLIEEHITTGIALGDIAQSFGIFYLKNKFGYTDKIENHNINNNIDNSLDKKLNELTLEELKSLANKNE